MVSYFLTDAMGSTIALTDSNGVVQTTYKYGPFGATNASGAANDNPYQFIGRELDPMTGGALYYMRARYLDTGMGRFVTRDPQGLLGSNFLAMYSYANNNPLAELDPTGHDSVPCVPDVGTLPAAPVDVRPSGSPFAPQDTAHRASQLAEAGSALAALGIAGVFGGTLSGTINGVAFTVQVGIGVDTSANIAGVFTWGGGAGIGEGLSGGGFAQVSNGSVGDLTGAFSQVSIGSGLVGADYFSGLSADGVVSGIGVSYGLGGGLSASNMGTDTVVVPLN